MQPRTIFNLDQYITERSGIPTYIRREAINRRIDEWCRRNRREIYRRLRIPSLR